MKLIALVSIILLMAIQSFGLTLKTTTTISKINTTINTTLSSRIQTIENETQRETQKTEENVSNITDNILRDLDRDIANVKIPTTDSIINDTSLVREIEPITNTEFVKDTPTISDGLIKTTEIKLAAPIILESPVTRVSIADSNTLGKANSEGKIPDLELPDQASETAKRNVEEKQGGAQGEDKGKGPKPKPKKPKSNEVKERKADLDYSTRYVFVLPIPKVSKKLSLPPVVK